MDSKSWTTTSTVQCQASNRHLRRHTVPILYTIEDCRSNWNIKTSKRKSEESLERAPKRSRTSQSPSEGCSRIYSGPSSSHHAASSAPETPCLSGRSDGPVLGTGEKKVSSKRKSTSNEREEGPRKKSRPTPSSAEDHFVSTGSSSLNEVAGPPILSSRSRKRKSEETEGPRKRSRKTSEGPSQQASSEDSSSDKPGPSSSSCTAPPDSRASFEAKYNEEGLLGKGGFGSVFAGYRKDDNLPVAIKHIPPFGIRRTNMLLNGKICKVPLEVLLLLKLKPAAGETSAVIHLLDWYDLDKELILVLERPVPCMDLLDYVNSTGSSLQEYEAKIITKQLVDAFIEVHSRGVFHRDIKLDNILIETGSDVPRPRIIDFGCGTFLSEGMYAGGQGTFVYTSPECFLGGRYQAEPTTVWQLGVVLFGMLHGHLPFRDSGEIVYSYPDIDDSLTFDCQGFLQSCLVKSPEARPTLETLQHHPWLM